MANLHAPDDKVISLLAALRSIDAADRSTHLMKMAELDPSFHVSRTSLSDLLNHP